MFFRPFSQRGCGFETGLRQDIIIIILVIILIVIIISINMNIVIIAIATIDYGLLVQYTRHRYSVNFEMRFDSIASLSLNQRSKSSQKKKHCCLLLYPGERKYFLYLLETLRCISQPIAKYFVTLSDYVLKAPWQRVCLDYLLLRPENGWSHPAGFLIF